MELHSASSSTSWAFASRAPKPNRHTSNRTGWCSAPPHAEWPSYEANSRSSPGGVRCSRTLCFTAHLRPVARHPGGRRPDPVGRSSLDPLRPGPHAERHQAQVLAQQDPARAAGSGLRGRLRQNGGTPTQSRPRPARPTFARTRPGRQWLGSRARSAFSHPKDVLLLSPRCSACLGVHVCTKRHERVARDAVAHAGSQICPPAHTSQRLYARHFPTEWTTTACWGPGQGVRSAPCPVPPSFWGRNVGSRARSAFSHPKDVLLLSPRCSACRRVTGRQCALTQGTSSDRVCGFHMFRPVAERAQKRSLSYGRCCRWSFRF